MDSTDHPAEDKLSQAAGFIKSGKQDDARLLLREVLMADRNNLLAWELLFHVAQNQEEKAFCLKTILKLRPDHPWARQQLAEITTPAELATQVLSDANPPQPGPAPLRTPPGSGGGTPQEPQKKKKPARFLLVAAIVFVALVCVGMVGIVVARVDYLYRNSQADLAATASPPVIKTVRRSFSRRYRPLEVPASKLAPIRSVTGITSSRRISIHPPPSVSPSAAMWWISACCKTCPLLRSKLIRTSGAWPSSKSSPICPIPCPVKR